MLSISKHESPIINAPFFTHSFFTYGYVVGSVFPEFAKEIIEGYDYNAFFDSISIKTKLIDELAYPVSESAVSVREALLNECKKLGIQINIEEKLIDYKVNKQIEIISYYGNYTYAIS